MKTICKKCGRELAYEEQAKNAEGCRISQCIDCPRPPKVLPKSTPRKYLLGEYCRYCNTLLDKLNSFHQRKICLTCKNKLKSWEMEGREWLRSQVRARDNYTCQHCGKIWKEGRKFDVHHLFEMKASRKFDKEKDINKLITLCHKCHTQLHYRYGYLDEKGRWKVGQIPLSEFNLDENIKMLLLTPTLADSNALC